MADESSPDSPQPPDAPVVGDEEGPEGDLEQPEHVRPTSTAQQNTQFIAAPESGASGGDEQEDDEEEVKAEGSQQGPGEADGKDDPPLLG